MNLFKGIAIFIGWLTSSLAGIVAILYASGYLVTISRLHLLGLDGLVVHGNDYFLREGGKFFLAMGEQFGEMLLNVLVLAAVLASPVVVVCVLLMIFKKDKVAVLQTRFKDRLIVFGNKCPVLWRGMLYAGLLLMLFYIIEDPQSFNDPLKISNLLYQSATDDTLHGSARKVARLLVDGDTTQLNSFFTDAVLFEVKAAILLLLAWHGTASWSARPLLVAPFIIVFMLYTIFLPMLYGVLKHQVRFPVITLNSDNELLSTTTGKLFLLNKNDQEFVVWDPARKKVLWIPLGEVKAALVGQAEPVFEHPDTPH